MTEIGDVLKAIGLMVIVAVVGYYGVVGALHVLDWVVDKVAERYAPTPDYNVNLSVEDKTPNYDVNMSIEDEAPDFVNLDSNPKGVLLFKNFSVQMSSPSGAMPIQCQVESLPNGVISLLCFHPQTQFNNGSITQGYVLTANIEVNEYWFDRDKLIEQNVTVG